MKTLVGKSGAWLAVEGKGWGKETRRPPDSWQVYPVLVTETGNSSKGADVV